MSTLRSRWDLSDVEVSESALDAALRVRKYRQQQRNGGLVTP